MNRQFGFAAVLGLLVAGSPQLDGQPIDSVTRPHITVLLCDKAGVDPEIRKTGKAQAGRILRSAGVDVTWIDSTDRTKLPATFDPTSFEGCELPTIDHDFMVIIAAEAPKGKAPDVMGHANAAGSYPRAYVLYKRVRAFAGDHGVRNAGMAEVGNIMGHVIAHEIGHLLMPGKPHTPGGIMSANWTGTEWHDAIQGALLFSPSQAKQIQSRLTTMPQPPQFAIGAVR